MRGGAPLPQGAVRGHYFIRQALETVLKGFGVVSGASIFGSQSSEIGLFAPFRRLLRLQIEAHRGFSDSFRVVFPETRGGR